MARLRAGGDLSLAGVLGGKSDKGQRPSPCPPPDRGGGRLSPSLFMKRRNALRLDVAGNLLPGATFGRLTLLKEVDPVVRSYPQRRVHLTRRFLCTCVCGMEKVIDGAHLRSGRTQSCGCLRREVTGASRRSHGDTAGRTKSTEYTTWRSMRDRCNNPRNPDYKYYGGLGVSVCDRWHLFENFLADMGRRPGPGFSIDRYPDNSGDYKPGNCRWATPTEQSRNRRPYGRNVLQAGLL